MRIMIAVSCVLFALLYPMDLNAYATSLHSVLHILGGGAIAFFIAFFSKSKYKIGFVVVACVAAECVQLLTPHRAFEIGDIVANLIGCVLYFTLSAMILKYKNK
jgi:glycopeptide antibiotics resistance protein